MIRVAYVDDEPVLLDVVKEILELDQDVIVETFESPRRALDILQTRRYDAIISDFQMPEMDGLEFLKRVRSSGDQIPFIIFTGKGREEVAMEALNRGANFYLQKGADTRLVCRELSNALLQLVHMTRAEVASRINEQKYKDIMENSNSLIMLLDVKGTITFINRYARRFFGFNDDLVGQSIIGTILPAGDRSRLDLVRMRHGWLNDPDRFNSVVVRNQKANGSPVWIAWSSKAVRDKDGRIVGMKSIGNDISAQMVDEDEMDQTKRLIRTTIDAMPVPMLAVGWKGEILTFNRHFSRLWGTLSEVKVGDESVELLPRIYALLNDPRGFENDILNVADRENDKVTRFNLKDGRELTFIPMPPQDQSPVAMLWSISVDCGQKNARNDRSAFAGGDVADNSPDLLLQIDADGIITYASRSHLDALGHDPSRLFGRPIEDLLAPGEERKVLDGMNESVLDGEVASLDINFKGLDGTLAAYSVRLRPLRSGDNRPAGAVLSSREIAEGKEKERIKQSQAAMASILRNIHDLDY